jgi:hypothetical protein
MNGLRLGNLSTPNGQYIEDFVFVEGSGTLDASNGRFCVTPEYPGGTYAYFVTVDSTNHPVYPYVIGPTYYGRPYGLSYSYVNGVNTPLYPNGAVTIPYTPTTDTVNGYIRTPDGSISSDPITLQQPIYAPWNNNHLTNPQVIRSIDTSLRFDRVSSTVDYLTAKTSYANGSVLFSKALDIFVQALVPNANSANLSNSSIWNLSVGTQAIAESTAMNRIKASYTPSSNLFSNSARLLMSGVDYQGVEVDGGSFVESYPVPTGSLFDLDDDVSETSLNVAWHPSLISHTTLSTDNARFGNTSGSFGGATGQYLTANLSSPNISALGNTGNVFTLEFFCNTSNLGSNQKMVLVDTRNTSGSNTGMVIYKNTANAICFGSNLSTPILTSIDTITLNDWNFVTVQGQGNQMSLYLNGILQATGNTSTIFTDDALTFGADVTGQNVYSGYIDEFRWTSGINRYTFGSLNILVPTNPFPRSEAEDPYFDMPYTLVLYGFENLRNESTNDIRFQSINAQTYIGDLSWNKKMLQLVNYGPELIVDSQSLNPSSSSTIMSITLNQ